MSANNNAIITNRIQLLPKHIQNLIAEFNCDHRASIAPSLTYIQEHRNCVYCDCVVRGVDTIYFGVRFFCDTMCRDQWEYERSVDEYADECRDLNPDIYDWAVLNS
jgi:hypothetical protein